MINNIEPGERCCMSEGLFPIFGICCEARQGTFGTEYLSICPNCSVMTFPPDSATLKIATFYECSHFGYGKRITDARTPEQLKGKKDGGKTE